MSDRTAMLSRLEALSDDELERVVDLVDSGAFVAPPVILEERAIMADEGESRELMERNEELRQDAIKAIPLLQADPRFRQLQEEVLFRRERFWHRHARRVARFRDAVDQREIDYQRGFWNGAFWFAYYLPAEIEQALRRELLKTARKGKKE